MQDVSEKFEKLQGQFDVDLGIVHHFSSGVYAKQMFIPKGYQACSHKHPFDHLSILSKGHVIVRTDNSKKEYKAPACIEIKKEMHHEITALEDVVWFCIHATDETDASKIDDVILNKGE
jgi:quercetin dioxygenase-like cupin family protein